MNSEGVAALFACAVCCESAKSSESLVRDAAEGFQRLGFPHFGIYEARQEEGSVQFRFVLGRRHEAWQTHAQAAPAGLADPRVRHASQSSRAFFCSDILRDDPIMTRDERAWFDHARKFGLTESYVLPHRTAGGRLFAAVLIGLGLPLSPEIRVAVRMLATEFLFSAMRIDALARRGADPPIRLTGRQLQCLTLMAKGMSSAEIGRLLSLSPRTVDHYGVAICARLGVRNRAQAIAKAIALNLIAASG